MVPRTNRIAYLLVQLMEECNKVSQQCSVAIRSGLGEKLPGQTLTNSDRIGFEFLSLMTTYATLVAEAGLPLVEDGLVRIGGKTAYELMQTRDREVSDHFEFAASRGLIEGQQAAPNYPHPTNKPKTFLYVNTSGAGRPLRVVFIPTLQRLKIIPTDLPESLRGDADPLPPGAVEWAEECDVGQFWKVDDILIVRLT